MAKTNGAGKGTVAKLAKAPSGIQGLDEITGGGLPKGRPSLVCGGPGCGKTLLAMEFLVRGATEHGEPGVFIAFEETSDELTANVRSLGFDLDKLAEQKKLLIDHVILERNEIVENGEYDLNGLFIRLGYAIDSIGAKRVVLDTIETLFGGFANQAILRAELRRLFRWLKDKGVTAIITAERGEGTLTRQGMEEYVSDCVILLDHRVTDQVSTRRLRVVKYRGTAHGSNEYPFLIDAEGFSVLPITSAGLDHVASDERVSTGVARLDAMLGGAGLYRGSSVLVSGTAGTGKSSLAAQLAKESCARGERCLYFAFEESESQIVRNMGSIGIDLRPWIKKGILRFVAARPSGGGLETHLALMHRRIKEFQPRMVVVDPISNLVDAGVMRDATSMLMRLIDFLKTEQMTAVLTSLTKGGDQREETEVGISSLIDSWLMLRAIEIGGERNRGLYVLKSRGMAHSNQIREFLLTSRGIDLLDVYVGEQGVLTGSMRISQEARERVAEEDRVRDADSKRRASDRRRRALEAQIAVLRAELEGEEDGGRRAVAGERDRLTRRREDRDDMARSRKADAGKEATNGRGGVRTGART
ncbi:MAG TPA: circadian clock protein KaiC [Polyangia bacterium]|nr:circadian clock protein KaiC [Polyangia bacterium]